jgi:hypothetical protein
MRNLHPEHLKSPGTEQGPGLCRFAVARGDGCVSVHDVHLAEQQMAAQDAAEAVLKAERHKALKVLSKAKRSGRAGAPGVAAPVAIPASTASQGVH